MTFPAPTNLCPFDQYELVHDDDEADWFCPQCGNAWEKLPATEDNARDHTPAATDDSPSPPGTHPTTR